MNIRAEVARACSDTTDDDVVVLYVCGKGIFANGNLALITADKSVVLYIRDLLAPLKQCAANCLVMLDFTHNGGRQDLGYPLMQGID